MAAVLCFDGGCSPNPGSGGAGALIDIDGQRVWEASRSLGRSTNNTAEYSGLLLGLEQLATLSGLHSLCVYGDSQLVVQQLMGRMACRSPDLLPLLQRALALLARLPSASIQHIQRAHNDAADALATEGVRGITSSNAYAGLRAYQGGGGSYGGGGGGAVRDTVPFAPPRERLCAGCFETLPMAAFSATQRAHGARGRCTACVAAGVVSSPSQNPAALCNAGRCAAVERHAFAEGSLKRCYRGTYSDGSGGRCVVKEFRDGGEAYFAVEVEISATAARILAAFNSQGILPQGMRLVLARPEVWRCSEGGYFGGDKVASEGGEGERVLVEPFIEGFRKFNSNSGFKGAGTYAAIGDALSHYSFHFSSGALVLCDLQGGTTLSGAQLTDPCLMSTTQRYGPTDLGRDGISNFFACVRLPPLFSLLFSPQLSLQPPPPFPSMRAPAGTTCATRTVGRGGGGCPRTASACLSPRRAPSRAELGRQWVSSHRGSVHRRPYTCM